MSPAEVDANANVPAPADGSGKVVLSAGATLALGTVASRVLRSGAKRPRGVLAACEETAQELAEAAAVGRQEKARRRARRAFDAMARVVPDAATDAGRERALRATATRGAVALFNAVAKAQRKASSDEKPVERAQFRDMLRGGTAAAAAAGAGAGAKWLSDDYMTAAARKMKKFDTDAADADADADADDEADDESDDEEESEVELEDEFEDEEEEEELEEEDE